MSLQGQKLIILRGNELYKTRLCIVLQPKFKLKKPFQYIRVEIRMGKQQKLFDSTPSNGKNIKPAPKFKSDRVKELQELVEYHQHLYYNSQPEISDEEFDRLWDELKNLDPNNELFSKIGADYDTALNKVKHIIPMNSQAKVTNSGEFNKWARKMGYDLFITQFKLDGISVELQYLSGKFKYGVTRGDGLIGDDVSNNIS